MKKKIPRYILSILSFFLLSCSLFSASTPTPALNQPFYHFEKEEIDEIEIQRSFPGEEPWKIILKKQVINPAQAQWELTQAPIPLADPIAHASLVDHLLETLTTFSPTQIPPKDTRKNFLEAVHLSPPRALLKWKGSGQVHTLALGDPYSKTERFALFEKTAPMLAAGATLQMLQFIQRWEDFRNSVLVLGKLDDWDRILIEKTIGKRERNLSQSFYSLERVGVHWETTAQKEVTSQVTPLLENLTHQRIKGFVDSTERQNQLKNQFLKEPNGQDSIHIIFLDRQNQTQKISTFQDSEKKVWVQSESRSNLFFEAYPSWLEQLNRLYQVLSQARTQASSTPRKSSTK